MTDETNEQTTYERLEAQIFEHMATIEPASTPAADFASLAQALESIDRMKWRTSIAKALPGMMQQFMVGLVQGIRAAGGDADDSEQEAFQRHMRAAEHMLQQGSILQGAEYLTEAATYLSETPETRQQRQELFERIADTYEKALDQDLPKCERLREVLELLELYGDEVREVHGSNAEISPKLQASIARLHERQSKPAT